MACFLVPMAEAIVISVVKKSVEKKELAAGVEKGSSSSAKRVISWSRKLGWLNKLLWGGVALLALEHVWHGEVVPWPPFLTVLSNPADIAPMLNEMAITGGGMAICVTIIWIIMVLIADHKAKTALAELKPDA